MKKKTIAILLYIFLALTLYAESNQYEINNYLIFEETYTLNKKTYSALKYFKSKDLLLSENYDSIYLMVASPSVDSIGSIGGHTFLVLSHGDELTSSVAINFYGEHEHLGTLEKAITGSTLGLPGYIDIRPFSQIAERYTIGQERTVFYFKLDLNKESINNLIIKLYDIIDNPPSYQFFTENCADLSMRLVDAATDKDLSAQTPYLIIPSYIPVILENNGLITETGTFTPPIAKVNKENLNISREKIKEKKEYYDENLNETQSLDELLSFVPQKDLYDYGTTLDSYMSLVSFGNKNYNPTLGWSFFSSRRYKQIQGPTQALQINLLELKLVYDDEIKLESFKIFEFSSYPKINYGFDFTKKFMLIGESGANNIIEPLFRGGYGISLGNSNILFDLTSDIDIPLSKLAFNLSLNSELILYNKYAFILLEGNFPYYQINSNKEISIKNKAGFTLFERLDIEGSYSWSDKIFETSFVWNFSPF